MININEFEKKAYNPEQGITVEEYLRLRKELSKMSDNNKYKARLEDLVTRLRKTDIAHAFTHDNYVYIVNKLSVLPFIFGKGGFNKHEFKSGYIKFYYGFKNNKHIKILKVYNETTHIKEIDIIVNNRTNTRYLTNAEYVSEIEHIDLEAALKVILGVYNCDCEDISENLYPIIEKYQDVFTSEEFCEFASFGGFEWLNDIRDRVIDEKKDPNFTYVRPKRKVYLEK